MKSLFICSALFSILTFLPSILSQSYVPSTEVNDALTISRLSYCKIDQIEKFNCEACEKEILIGVYDPESDASTQVVITGNRDVITAGFRGTMKTVQQWLSNFDTKYVKWDVGRVHEGFYKRFDEVVDYSVKKLYEARKKFPEADIYLTGHSMGGAIATLVASYVKAKESKTIHPDMVYTFGSPRVGDKKFATYVNSQYGETILRVMNEWDMIPDLPPSILGFRHVGVLITCKTATSTCKKGSNLEENKGGLIGAIKRSYETSKNVKLSHLTYLNKGVGSNRFICDESHK